MQEMTFKNAVDRTVLVGSTVVYFEVIATTTNPKEFEPRLLSVGLPKSHLLAATDISLPLGNGFLS